MFKSKRELLEEKLELEREDFYKKGRILMENNDSVDALNDYKEACVKYFDTESKVDALDKADEERIERIRENIRERDLYKFSEYCLEVLDNFVDKCEDVYKTYIKKK